MKLKHYGVVLIPACVATFVFRLVEVVLAVDPQTGYYRSGAILPMIFNLFMAALVIFFATMLFVTKKESHSAVIRLYKPSVFDNVVGIAASVALFAASLFELLENTVGYALSLSDLLSLWSLWQTLCALLAAVFVIFFVTYPRKTAKKPGWQIFSLGLMLYYLVLLLKSFATPDVVFSQAFGIYDVAFYGLTAAAALNLSKVLTGIHCRRMYTFFTFASALACALRLANAVLRVLPGDPYGIPMDLFPFVGDLLVTIFLISLAKKLIVRRKRSAGDLPEYPGQM